MIPLVIDLTPQQIVDVVVRGAHAQRWEMSMRVQPGISGREMASVCSYRGDAGRKCHAGHLLPDDYAKAWERSTVRSRIDKGDLVCSVADSAVTLERLQFAHDGSASRGVNLAATIAAVWALGLFWPEDVPQTLDA
jgi:hypothetical protein